jgi:hypothetical protein
MKMFLRTLLLAFAVLPDVRSFEDGTSSEVVEQVMKDLRF